jgi:hypothetical protein
MPSRVVVVLSFVIAVGVGTPLLAASIPCTLSASTECVTNPTCQANGFCRGEPANEGQPCTQEATSGGCMAEAVCKKGVCTGTVPLPDGTECNYAGLEKCYTPGHCTSIPSAGLSFCTLGTPKSCPQPTDPCKLSVCNPQTGQCVEGDRCPGVFYGCEVCNAGTCTAVNLGGPCANSEGDFNDCTTDDHCALVATSSVAELDPAASALMPVGLAAALVDAQQVGTTIAICQGVAGGAGPTATPTTLPTQTPTAMPGSCAGDCNDDQVVTVGEVVTMANITLGIAKYSACPGGDADNDGVIRINEVVVGVNHALHGCAG